MELYNSSTRIGTQRAGYQASNATAQNDALLWKCLILLGLLYLVWTDRIAIHLNYGTVEPTAQPAAAASLAPTAAPAMLSETSIVAPPTPTSFTSPFETRRTTLALPAHAKGHIRFVIDPAFAQRNGVPSDEVKRSLELCRTYIERYAPVAEAEMRHFGIPASITLAQGLLESNAGDSPLARKTNNHFGIKCFSRTCKRGHCVNFTDDSHKDFFVRYDNAWSSFRAHSQFLKNSKRYAALFKLDPTDYRAWAHGLQRAGYATDPLYAEKLIAIVENLGLSRFDDASMP